MGHRVTVEDLVEIEAIKQLKARYFRFMDTRQWDEFAEVFTEDAVLDVRSDAGSGGVVRGRDRIVAGIRSAIGAASTVHHGHMPEIEITGPNAARGIWAMFDRVEFPSEGVPSGIQGWGHYHEVYAREGGCWRIARLELVRLRRDPL